MQTVAWNGNCLKLPKSWGKNTDHHHTCITYFCFDDPTTFFPDMLLIRVILGIFYRTTEVDVGVRSLRAVPVGSGVHLVHLVHVLLRLGLFLLWSRFRWKIKSSDEAAQLLWRHLLLTSFWRFWSLRQLENHIRERQNRQIGSERFRTLRAGRGRLWLTQIKASHGGSSVNDSTFGLSMMGSKDDPVISTVVNQSLWQVLAVKTTFYGDDCYGSQLNAIVNEMETLLEQLFNLMEASCVISKNGFEDDEGKKTFQTWC